MGVRGFFPWLTKMGYRPDLEFFVLVKHSLIVDVKTFMYRFGYRVAVDDPDFCKQVADAIVEQFGAFERVMLVNDGKIDDSHAKFETTKHRAEVRQNNKRKNQEMRACANLSDTQLAKLDRSERAARGVSFAHANRIMELLSARSNFECVQCEGEADDYIALHHKEFDIVVSQDSDFLVAGVACLLCNIGTQKQALYRIFEILEHLHITQLQLQEIAAIAGNDYTGVGIRGLGLDTACELIRKYGNCRQMLQKWTPQERSGVVVEPAFFEAFNRSMLTYSKDPILLNVDIPVPKPIFSLDEPEQQKNEFLDLMVTCKKSKIELCDEQDQEK